MFFEFRPGAEGAVRDLVGRLVFVLSDDELHLVRGPYDRQGPHSNFNINGTLLWLGNPELSHAILYVDQPGTALVAGLRPGTYSLRAFPDDLRFEPSSLVVEEGEATASIAIEWWSR